jgi:integrase
MKRRNGLRVYIRKQRDRDHLTLYYHAPGSGRIKTKSAETSDRKEAERAAALWEASLLEHHGQDGSGWEAFRERFEGEHLAFKGRKTMLSYRTALNSFEEFAQPSTLHQITTAKLSSYAAAMSKKGHPHATVKNYLTHLRAAFRWAERLGIMRKAPHTTLPSTGTRRHMRGRPLKPREVAKLLKACRTLYGTAWREWRRLIKLLWYSGLRLGESLDLSWDTPPLVVRLNAKPYPLIIIDSEGQKSRSDQAMPLAPDLFAWLSKTPEADRCGPVIDVRNAAGNRYTVEKLSDEVSLIGRTAGVVTEPGDDPKHATAHDLRRTFGTRWALKVRPMTLQRMMRHKDLSTTLRFYVGLSVEDLGAELWAPGRKDS